MKHWAQSRSLNPLKRLREYIHVMEFKTGKGNEYGRFISSIERAEFQEQCELASNACGYTIAVQCDAMLAKLQVIGESVVGRARRGAAMQSAISAVSGWMSSTPIDGIHGRDGVHGVAGQDGLNGRDGFDRAAEVAFTEVCATA